jgi:hypothetical protein
MPRKPSKDASEIPELKALLQELGSQHKFSKWISDMCVVLKENMFAGELVEKKKIPSYYIDKYGVDHLYRYDHREGHRSCYVIYKGSCFILDIMTHKEYVKRFGYRTT